MSNNSAIDTNVTLEWVGSNETIEQVQKLFHINITYNLTDQSDETQAKLFDLYEMYKSKESEQLAVYRFVAFVLGALIILSNLIVVISSGLILKKGQQPKSTYLLLGNVSLADTIVGFSIIIGASIGDSSTNIMCVFQIGMLVCPAMVSIFSVGLIAVDRYIYIIHGLYYQRWFSTTRVRIGILCIWMIGLILGFIPITGWVNRERHPSGCTYVSLFPGSVVLLNSIISIIPIVVVAVLYSMILVKALANVRRIGASQTVQTSQSQNSKLRIYIGNQQPNKLTTSRSVKHLSKLQECKLKRSASFDDRFKTNPTQKIKYKSVDDLSIQDNNSEQINDAKSNSEFSIISSNSSTAQTSQTDISHQPNLNSTSAIKPKKTKPKKPNKWRAITVVMLTSGCFLITWLPFFITVIFYVLCEEKFTDPKCFNMGSVLRGPLVTLALLNSVINPLIYAWWHKGFQRYARKHCQKYLQKYFRGHKNNK